MMSYTPLPEPSPHMFRVQFSPQRKRTTHSRTESEFIPRPLSVVPMSPSKRSSVYVSEASTLLSHRNSVVSPVGRSQYDSLFSPTSDPSRLLSPEPAEFVDHYAILELGPEATVDEIKAAFRRLRVAYFQTDATKYRALTTAMELLADKEARSEYDEIYRARATGASTPYSSLPAGLESPKHGRKDSGHSAGSLPDDVDMTPVQEIPEEEEDQPYEEPQDLRTDDPNWALKRRDSLSANYEPFYGTEPYHSFIPVLKTYGTYSRHPRLRCRRPTYTGNGLARNAMP